ncbi:MAG: molybdopterin oxidoreductase [Chthonomonadaceae bacterium]|nr:molybdopterin oxidoreductase [Chthonomonadaceae bacterium]
MTFAASSRFEQMVSEGVARPFFFQGVFPFLGNGLMNPRLLNLELVYTVPSGCKVALMYFRGGNASDQMIYVSVVSNGVARRYFPIGPQDGTHVELVIKEDIPAGTKLELHLAAGAGVMGTVVVDVGFLEWNEG